MQIAIQAAINGEWNPFKFTWRDGHQHAELFKNLKLIERKACAAAVKALPWKVLTTSGPEAKATASTHKVLLTLIHLVTIRIMF